MRHVRRTLGGVTGVIAGASAPPAYAQSGEYVPYGTCVGDAGNGSSTDAQAQMTDACNGASGYGGSYGTLFLLLNDNCSYGWVLFNVHWGGYLSYSGFSNYVLPEHNRGELHGLFPGLSLTS
jgi:hypothetical protein